MKKIVIGFDHAGFALKADIIAYLKEQNFDVIDVGTFDDSACNYIEYAKQACKIIQIKECELGVLVCGTGIGMSMAANKHNGIRAACCSDTFSARMTRLHNDANVLCIGQRVVGKGLALDLIGAFVNTSFEGGRHTERVEMLMDIEKEN